MRAVGARRTVTVDAFDRQIIHALQIEPRAAFRTIASLLDVSEQTVARRRRNSSCHSRCSLLVAAA